MDTGTAGRVRTVVHSSAQLSVDRADSKGKDSSALSEVAHARSDLVECLHLGEAVGRHRDPLIGRGPRSCRRKGGPAGCARRRDAARNDSRLRCDARQRIHLDITSSRPASGGDMVSHGGGAVAEGQRKDASGEDVHQVQFHGLWFM